MRNDDEKAWWDWCALVQVDDADRAWVPKFLDVFDGCLRAYNLEDITEVGQIRELSGRQWQWCRVWCFSTDQYEWRWMLCCEDCGSARCYSRKTTH